MSIRPRQQPDARAPNRPRCRGRGLPSFCAPLPGTNAEETGAAPKRLGRHSPVADNHLCESRPAVSLTSLVRSALALPLTFLSVPGTMHCMEPGENINWLAQVRRGVAEHCVLALLTSGERYGFELARELGARGQIIASEGTLYPLLARLRRNGLVETSWRESTAGPPRRYYHLTRDGELALASFKKQWRVFSDAVDEILHEGSQE